MKLFLIVAAIVGSQATSNSQEVAKQVELLVIGLDGKQLHLTVADLDRMPQEKESVTNEDGSKSLLGGVSLRSVLDKVGVPTGEALRGESLQQIVSVAARDGYSVPFTVGELDPAFGKLRALIVYRRDGRPMFDYQGPFRLLCPNDKAGARSVRMVATIRVTNFDAKQAR